MNGQHPAVGHVAAVATALGELCGRVVFIGGAIAPLLQTEPPFPRARATSDVDGVMATVTNAEAHRFEAKLATRGFRRDPTDGLHAHRWISPDGIPFDLVPAGEHLGGSGNLWDTVAIQTAVEATLAGGVTILHASAPAFLALKWAAHQDRGRDDPVNSQDLEDILALLASRPGIADEVAAAPGELRGFLAEQSRSFLRDPAAEDLLAAHLNNAQDPAHTIAAVSARLEVLGRE